MNEKEQEANEKEKDRMKKMVLGVYNSLLTSGARLAKNHLDIMAVDFYDLIGDFLLDRGDFGNGDFLVKAAVPNTTKTEMSFNVVVDLLSNGKTVNRLVNTIDSSDILMYIRKYGRTIMYTVSQWSDKPKAVILLFTDDEVNLEEKVNEIFA